MTPLPRRNPGAFTDAARAGTAPPAPSTGPPERRPPRPGIDDSGIGLIDLVAELEQHDITPLLPYAGTGADRPRWPSRRTNQLLLILLAASAVAATAILLAGARTDHHTAAGPSKGPSSVPSGSAPAGPLSAGSAPVALTFPCPDRATGTLEPVPLGPPTVHRQAPVAGYTWFVSRDGVAITVPTSWQMISSGDVTCFYDPTSARVLGVTSMASASHDPATVLRSARNDLFAKVGSLLGYVQVALADDAYAPRSGHWEYTYLAGSGSAMHVKTELIMPAKGRRALAFSFETTDFDWHADDFVFTMLLSSFLLNV